MKKYVVYLQDYEFINIHVVCDTRADAEEYLLALVEESNYEDYLNNYVGSYTEHNDPFYDYWYDIKQNTVIRNSMASTYQKHDWTPAGWELYSMSRDYVIAEVDAYG